MDQRLEAFQRLLNTLEDLRELCPWDRKQTFESLRPNTIEETYELADALLNKDYDTIKEELGDLLLHVVFYSKIGQEQEAFDITSVCDAIVNKLVSRHPHIYGDESAESEEQVKQNWEQLKQKEKANKGTFEGVPDALPALIKALRLQEKASGVGFDWNESEEVSHKVREEMEEFIEQTEKHDIHHQEMEAEFGDLLFSLVNYARFLKIDPDNALEKTNQKFKTRFNCMEKDIKAAGKSMKEMPIEELENHWQAAKSSSRYTE